MFKDTFNGTTNYCTHTTIAGKICDKCLGKPMNTEPQKEVQGDWIEEFDKKFVKLDMKEMGQAIGMTLNSEILFSGKENDIKHFIQQQKDLSYSQGKEDMKWAVEKIIRGVEEERELNKK